MGNIVNMFNTLTRRVGCGLLQRGAHMVRVLWQKPVEDHLRVTLIRSGDTVIIKKAAEASEFTGLF